MAVVRILDVTYDQERDGDGCCKDTRRDVRPRAR